MNLIGFFLVISQFSVNTYDAISECVCFAPQLLGCESSDLIFALTNRSIMADRQKVGTHYPHRVCQVPSSAPYLKIQRQKNKGF